MRDRKLVGSRQRSLSCRFSLSRRERPLLTGKFREKLTLSLLREQFEHAVCEILNTFVLLDKSLLPHLE